MAPPRSRSAANKSTPSPRGFKSKSLSKGDDVVNLVEDSDEEDHDKNDDKND